jgi:hypothetical protein
MGRIIRTLGQQLRRQRQLGRSPAGDVVQGFVIEDGEAEGLIAELTGRWDGDEPQVDTGNLDAAIERDEVADLAEAAASAGAFLPLRHAIRNFELTREVYDALVLVLAVETDARFTGPCNCWLTKWSSWVWSIRSAPKRCVRR